MNRTNKSIEDLCTSYCAYMRAISERNDNAIVVWAKCLIDDQIETGVTMISNEILRNTIAVRQSILEEAY